MNDLTKEISGYKIYLQLLEERLLTKYFENQKDYIFCKKGCADCCKHGEYPTTKIELQYIALGFVQLPKDLQQEILMKINEIAERKRNYTAKVPFTYECPFLVNNVCCLYDYRMIICRTHGLMFFMDNNGKNENKIPACVHLGLNYSNVYDKETNMISSDMWQKTGIKNPPLAYNISQKVLLNNIMTEPLGFEFGETKALIDWFYDADVQLK